MEKRVGKKEWRREWEKMNGEESGKKGMEKRVGKKG